MFERVLVEVEALHAGALAFMRSLSTLMRTVEHVGENEFERGKGALLEHLRGFRLSRSQHSAEILALLDRIEAIGAQLLVAWIVDAEQFVALPGGATVGEQRARRRQELLSRWRGWLCSSTRQRSMPTCVSSVVIRRSTPPIFGCCATPIATRFSAWVLLLLNGAAGQQPKKRSTRSRQRLSRPSMRKRHPRRPRSDRLGSGSYRPGAAGTARPELRP